MPGTARRGRAPARARCARRAKRVLRRALLKRQQQRQVWYVWQCRASPPLNHNIERLEGYRRDMLAEEHIHGEQHADDVPQQPVSTTEGKRGR